jgi:WD40 repeat protein
VFGLDWIDDEHFVTVSSDKLIKIWNTKFEEKYTIAVAAEEELKDMKKYGLFLVAVKVYKDTIYVANIDGDILVYSNPITTGQSALQHRYVGSRKKIVKLLNWDPATLILLDSGGRVLVYDIEKN